MIQTWERALGRAGLDHGAGVVFCAADEAACVVRIELAAPPADGGDEIDLDEVDLRDVLLGAEADPPT